MDKKFIVYTDGSVNNAISLEERNGGWGAVILHRGNEDYHDGMGYRITSQQAEFLAIIQCLNLIRTKTGEKKVLVEIHSDSAYIVGCFIDKWYELWEAKSFMGIKNVSYWKRLLELVFKTNMEVTFIKVKGHSGDKYNDIADKLAGEARLRAERLLKDVS